MAGVLVSEAQRILGVGPAADEDAVRAAYHRRLLRTHPDVSAERDATDRTVQLTQAYTTLLDASAADGGGSVSPSTTEAVTDPAPGPFPHDDPQARSVRVSLVADDTIGVGAPPDETLLMVIEAAHELGEIVYLDPSAGLIEVIVEFIGEPTSSVLMSLQGRATGMTEVFCTVEPLSGGEAPPGDAVTRLIARTLAGERPS